MIDKTFRDVVQKCAESIPVNGNDYLVNGIIHCGVCNEPKQVKIKNKFFDGLVSCMCKCSEVEYEKLYEKMKAQEREAEIKDLRKACISNWGMHSMTFQNDKGYSPELIAKVKKYADNWDEMHKRNVGLYIFGDVGLGKTYAAACIANALIDKGVKAYMTDFQTIFNAMRSLDTHDKNAYINNICCSDLLIIDDLGAERMSEYDFPIAEQVIDIRANTQKPIIITSNIPYKSIENPTNAKHARMYSRIKGMTVPIALDGTDKRGMVHKNNVNWARELFR